MYLNLYRRAMNLKIHLSPLTEEALEHGGKVDPVEYYPSQYGERYGYQDYNAYYLKSYGLPRCKLNGNQVFRYAD